LALCVTAAKCTDEYGPNISGLNPLSVFEVRIEPRLDTIAIPDTVRGTDQLMLHAVALRPAFTADGRESFYSDVRFVWTSSDPTIAIVDSFGVVTPVRPGAVEITASAGKVGHATVVIVPAMQSVSIEPSSATIFVGDQIDPSSDTLRFTAIARDAAGAVLTGVAFGWQSSDPTVATVTVAGTAVARGLGTTIITASTTNGHQATASLSVVPATSGSNVSPGPGRSRTGRAYFP
jgi:uncharacterized protein YjdB